MAIPTDTYQFMRTADAVREFPQLQAIVDAYNEFKNEFDGMALVIAGGAIRDTMFGTPVNDWDVYLSRHAYSPLFKKLFPLAFKQVSQPETFAKEGYKGTNLGVFEIANRNVDVTFGKYTYHNEWAPNLAAYDGHWFINIDKIVDVMTGGEWKFFKDDNRRDVLTAQYAKQLLERGERFAQRYGITLNADDVAMLQEIVSLYEADFSDTPPRGLRAYRISGATLMGMYDNYWYSEKMVSECNGSTEMAALHLEEGDCACGIYAFRDSAYGEKKLASYKGHSGHAIAEVVMWGNVIIAEHGYRAQYARIERLTLSSDTTEEKAEAIRRLYPGIKEIVIEEAN